VAEELCRLFPEDQNIDLTPILRKSKAASKRITSDPPQRRVEPRPRRGTRGRPGRRRGGRPAEFGRCGLSANKLENWFEKIDFYEQKTFGGA
jgi:hypothetical protein